MIAGRTPQMIFPHKDRLLELKLLKYMPFTRIEGLVALKFNILIPTSTLPVPPTMKNVPHTTQSAPHPVVSMHVSSSPPFAGLSLYPHAFLTSPHFLSHVQNPTTTSSASQLSSPLESISFKECMGDPIACERQDIQAFHTNLKEAHQGHQTLETQLHLSKIEAKYADHNLSEKLKESVEYHLLHIFQQLAHLFTPLTHICVLVNPRISSSLVSSTHLAVPYFARNTANSRPLPILDSLQPETCEGLNNHTPALLDIWLRHITSLTSLHIHSLALDSNMPMDTPIPRRVSGQSRLPPEADQRLPFTVSLSLLSSMEGTTSANGSTGTVVVSGTNGGGAIVVDVNAGGVNAGTYGGAKAHCVYGSVDISDCSDSLLLHDTLTYLQTSIGRDKTCFEPMGAIDKVALLPGFNQGPKGRNDLLTGGASQSCYRDTTPHSSRHHC